jgi:hypothetical protein
LNVKAMTDESMTDESMHGGPWADVTPAAHGVKTGSQKHHPSEVLLHCNRLGGILTVSRNNGATDGADRGPAF